MIKQTVLPFKLEMTKDLITSRAGLALMGEFAVGLGLNKALDRDLPEPGSGAGYLASEHVFPLVLMLNGGGRTLEFLKYCERQMPKGKKIKAFRADSAAYQAKVLNYCQSNGIEYAIGGDLDQAVKEVIATMKDEEWSPYQNGFIGETIHCMNETKEAFRLVVIRRPYQSNLFDDEVRAKRYTMIATNRGE